MDNKVIIVGSGGSGLMAAKIIELHSQHPEIEVVTIEEVKERDLTQTFEITAPPLLSEIDYFKPPQTRAESRSVKIRRNVLIENKDIMTNYTSEHISKEYSKLTKDKKIKILYEALDIMQSYNGRSKFLCIAMAMGYSNYEGENNTYTK